MRRMLLALSCVLLAGSLAACVVAPPRGGRDWVPGHYNRGGAWVPGHYR